MNITPLASLVMIHFKKGITKALISLGACAGWSALSLFTNSEDRFSCVEGTYLKIIFLISQAKHMLLVLNAMGWFFLTPKTGFN